MSAWATRLASLKQQTDRPQLSGNRRRSPGQSQSASSGTGSPNSASSTYSNSHNNKSHRSSSTNVATAPEPVADFSSGGDEFNAQEVLEYLHRNFQKQLANVNALDDTVIYKLLESNNQWKTKAPPAKKNGPPSRFNNQKKVDHRNNGFDLLYELNRSLHHKEQR